MAQLRLHQHAHFVRGSESRLRRAVGMEPDAVHPIGLIPLQNLFPCSRVHRRMPGLRPGCAVGLAAQKNPLPVQAQPVPRVRFKAPHPDGHAQFIPAQGPARPPHEHSQLQRVEPRMLRAPALQPGPPQPQPGQPHGLSALRRPQRPGPHLVFQRVADETDLHLRPGSLRAPANIRLQLRRFHFRIADQPRACQEDRRFRLQADFAKNAVPVGLGFIRRRGGVENRLRRPARIAVVRHKPELVFPGPQRPGFESPGGGERSRRHRLRRFPVHPQAQLPASLRGDNPAASFRQGVQRDLPGEFRRSGIGMLPCKPGADRVFPEKIILRPAGGNFAVPLFFRPVRAADSVLVQRTGQAGLRLRAVPQPNQPFSGKIDRDFLHCSALLPAASQT